MDTLPNELIELIALYILFPCDMLSLKKTCKDINYALTSETFTRHYRCTLIIINNAIQINLIHKKCILKDIKLIRSYIDDVKLRAGIIDELYDDLDEVMGELSKAEKSIIELRKMI